MTITSTANTYNNTLVRPGTLSISDPTNLGTGTNLSLANGALQTTAAISVGRNLIVSGVGTFDTGARVLRWARSAKWERQNHRHGDLPQSRGRRAHDQRRGRRGQWHRGIRRRVERRCRRPGNRRRA